MPRTLDAGLLAAMNGGNFTPYFKVQLMDSDRVTVLHETTDVLGFDLDGLTAKVSFHDPTNAQDFYTFRIQRGVLISGVPNYITSSCFWPLVDRHEKRIRTLEGHVFPNQFYSTPGDVTYSQVISAVCTHFNFSVVHETPGASWLSYQFLPTGRTFTLNDAKSFFSFLRQKYLIFATDLGNDSLYFYQSKLPGPAWPGGYTAVIAKHLAAPGAGAVKNKSFLSRDENATTHTSGSASDPIHNLGFLPSTAVHPTRTFFYDTNDWIVQGIAPNLKYFDFDALKVDVDVVSQSLWPAKVREVYDPRLSPSWQWQARYLDIFGNTEAGAIPSTIMAAAPYTPLNVSQFNKNLNTSQNNLQAFADKVDELDCGPAFYAATEMTVPLDADIIPVVDSLTSTHLVRKLYWSTVKSKVISSLLATANVFTNFQSISYTVTDPVAQIEALDISLHLVATANDDVNANHYGFSVGVYPQGAKNHTGSITGFIAYGYNNGSGVVTTLRGASFVIGNLSTGATTYATGLDVGVYSPGAGLITFLIAAKISWYAATATYMWGLSIQPNTGAAGHQKWGIQVGDVSGGDWNNWAIQTNAGAVTFNSAGAAEADFTSLTDNYTAINVDTSADSIVIMSSASGKIGFFGAAAIVKGTAFTQTYSTASHTVPLMTYVAPSGGATVDTNCRASLAQLAADVLAHLKVITAMIDDQQALGLFG
jgi:hypothetical protein